MKISGLWGIIFALLIMFVACDRSSKNRTKVLGKKSNVVVKKEPIQVDTTETKTMVTAGTFFLKGNSLAQEHLYKEALSAYYKAEEAGFKNLQKLYFEMAKVQAYAGYDTHQIIATLDKAMANGFDDYEQLWSEKAFRSWKENVKLSNEERFIACYHRWVGNDQKGLFEAFLAKGREKYFSRNYIIDPKNLFDANINLPDREPNYYKEHILIDVAFEQFVDKFLGTEVGGLFSRDPGNVRFMMYEWVLEDANYCAVLYSKEQPGLVEGYPNIIPKSTKLVTYDLGGNKISELVVAQRGSYKKCKGVIFDSDRTFDVHEYALSWKKGTFEEYYNEETGEERVLEFIYLKNSDLETTKITNSQSYKIDETGKIVKL